MKQHKYCKMLLGIFCIKHFQRCSLCLFPVLENDPHKITRDAHDDCIVRWTLRKLCVDI